MMGLPLCACLEQVDVLVNNAGFAYKGNVFGAAEAETTIAVNFSGTVAVSEALLAAGVIPDNGGGRIVNVCSGAGKLSIVPDPRLRAEFEHADSTEVLAALGTRFVDAIRRRKHAEEGWPSSMYGVSKLLEAQYSRVLAARLAPRRIAVSACSPGTARLLCSVGWGARPAAKRFRLATATRSCYAAAAAAAAAPAAGWCATDMSSWGGPRTAAQGAETPVWLALTADSERVSGKFWNKDQEEEPF